MNVLLSISVLLMDQVIKGWVRNYPVGTSLFFLPGILEFRYCVNTGAAFSMFSGNTQMVTALSIILLTLMYIYVVRTMQLSKLARTAFACLLGGGIGNLIDRIFCGSVTDYIRLLLIDFPVFNFADIAITLSVAALIILLVTGKLEQTNTGDDYGSNH